MINSGIKSYLREQIAFLVIIALLFGVVFSAFTLSHEKLAAFKNLEQQIGMFGEKVLICTDQGYEWKTWKEIAEGSNSESPDGSLKCKLCAASYTSADTISSYQNGIEYKELALDISVSQYRVYISSFDLRNSSPRSPPYFS